MNEQTNERKDTQRDNVTPRAKKVISNESSISNAFQKLNF